MEDEDEEIAAPKPPLKRKKPSALLSSGEEDEVRTSPPKKKAAVVSTKGSGGMHSKPKPQPVKKAVEPRKAPLKRRKDEDFIAPSSAEEASDINYTDDEDLPSKSKGNRKSQPKKPVQKAASTKASAKSSTAAKAAVKDGPDGGPPKPKFKCASPFYMLWRAQANLRN